MADSEQVMRRTFRLVAAAAMLGPALYAVPAAAQTNRAFVSGHGSDTGICPVTAPCRSFAYAAGQANPGGEVVVLDPAGYGAVTITKAISIVNDGVGEAGITVTAGNGITVNAGTADVVNLRGLTLAGSAGSASGVVLSTAAVLRIQNCAVRGFGDYGLDLIPGNTAQIVVSNTIVSNNGADGVSLRPTGGGTEIGALFERVQSLHNGNSGFFVTGSNAGDLINAIAVNSLASENQNGFAVTSTAATTTLVLNTSRAVGNTTAGLSAQGAKATMMLARSAATGNTADFTIGSGAVIDSFGDNEIAGNPNDVGTLTAAGLD